MKKLFTLLATAVLCLSASAESATYYYESDLTKGNKLTFTDGATLQITGNTNKEITSFNKITVNGSEYQTMKLSNGAQNTFTAPTDKVITNLTIYSFVNKDMTDEKARACYWKEVDGVSYTETTATNTGVYYYANNTFNGEGPVACSYSINYKASTTFTNTGEQHCIVLVVDYAEAGALKNADLKWSAESAKAVLGEEFTAPTLENPNNLAVTYDSSDKEVATINETGELTIVGLGTTTISAKSSETEEYAAGEATYTLKVTNPVATGSFLYYTDEGYYSWNNSDAKNAVKNTEGLSVQSVNTSKWLASGMAIVVNGNEYTSIRIANGNVNKLVAPEGKKLKRVTIYTLMNADRADNYGELYWKFNGKEFTDNPMNTFKNDDDAKNKAHEFTYTFDVPASEVEFQNVGKAPDVVIVVDYAVVAAPTHNYGDGASVADGQAIELTHADAEANIYWKWTYAAAEEQPTEPETPAAAPAHAPKDETWSDYKTVKPVFTANKNINGIQFYAEKDGVESDVVNLSVSHDGTSTGIMEVGVDANAPVEYYNLQGVRVSQPANGIYLMRQGSKVVKVLVK